MGEDVNGVAIYMSEDEEGVSQKEGRVQSHGNMKCVCTTRVAECRNKFCCSSHQENFEH